jgi:hypothetical protein
MGRARRISVSALLVVGGACGQNQLPAFPDGGSQELTLISSDWSIPTPGDEMYQCQRLTTTRDLYISQIDPVSPPGTHHDVVAMGGPRMADGKTTCDAFQSVTAESVVLYGSGLGTDSLVLPAGTAIHIPAGQQLLLNLHLFNATDGALSGTSGVVVKTTSAADAQHLASTVLIGPTSFSVPTGASTISGTCTVDRQLTLFSVLPHMHKLGTHMKVVANRAAGAVTLLDVDYTFDGQKNYPIAPMVDLQAGDTVNVDCTYFNPGAAVGFGESSNAEMCFAFVYLYPDFGSVFCSN